MLEHEHACFAEALEVVAGEIAVHNLIFGPPDRGQLEAVDLLLVGGSGDYSVTDSDLWIRQFFDFLADVVVDRNVPTFASCFGFQGLVMAGGGEVVTDERRSEVGTFTIHLKEAGYQDPLTGPLAPQFKAQLGHKDYARRLPAGVLDLAHSDRVPHQAFRVEGTHVFATQFHPELSRAANEMRYRRYRAAYLKGAVHRDDDVLETLDETPHATGLLKRWVDMVHADVDAKR